MAHDAPPERAGCADAADRLPRARGHLHRGGAPVASPTYAGADIAPLASLVDVLESVRQGRVDLGFIPLENAIEGTVRDIIDSLVFDFDLRIQREVVLDIHLHLMAAPGTGLADVERVASIPVATAQCRRFLTGTLPHAETVATNSTADAARLLGQHDPSLTARPTAAIAPRLAAELYGLEILAERVEDHPDNQTRFIAVARSGIPAPTGHDRTSIACFQSADHPGSLYAILGHFAARDINLTKLESRPTKQALGDYCFIIDFEGHVADAMVGRLPGRPPRRAGRGQVPRVLSGLGSRRSGDPGRGRRVPPTGRGLAGRAAIRDRHGLIPVDAVPVGVVAVGPHPVSPTGSSPDGRTGGTDPAPTSVRATTRAPARATSGTTGASPDRSVRAVPASRAPTSAATMMATPSHSSRRGRPATSVATTPVRVPVR